MDIFQSKQKAFPWSSDALLCDGSKKKKSPNSTLKRKAMKL